MGDSGNSHSIADYLAQLLKDKKQLAAFPNVFLHVDRLLDEEISKVRSNLFQFNGSVKKDPLALPEASGNAVTLSEKVYVPVKDHPDFNFVGRILGPRGMTAKQLEQETGCKIMVRGKGSMRDKKKEEQNRGKPNWEHLSDDLHVLISVEDTENRAQMKLNRAIEEIKKLLVPSQNDGEDELKKRQLMELAIINGTYRDSSAKGTEFEGLTCLPADLPRILTPGVNITSPLRTPTHLGGAPLIMPTRLHVPTSTGLLNGAAAAAHAGMPPPLIAASEASHPLLYTPYAAADYANYAAAALSSPLITDYPPDPTGSAVKQRRHLSQAREHPYQRAGSLT